MSSLPLNCSHMDVPRRIFAGHEDRTLRTVITCEDAGVISGLARARARAEELGLDFFSSLADGGRVRIGEKIAVVSGGPSLLAKAEDLLLGELSKTSGVATQARRALDLAGGRLRVVCGAFKKMPHVLRDTLRQAVADGGLELRMAPKPFVYLDKNYVRILGGVGPALKAAAPLACPVVIQLRGEFEPIEEEALTAAKMGAETLMVDTGSLDDLEKASRALRSNGLRRSVRLAFAGELDLEDLPGLCERDVDAVDIGYRVVDAPCLSMRMDVLAG